MSNDRPVTDDELLWHIEPLRFRGPLRSLFSTHPDMTARLDIRHYRSKLAPVLGRGWDLVVLNHLSSVWALPEVNRAQRYGRVGRWWYASQNDERAIWRQALKAPHTPPLERLGRAFDFPRVSVSQRRLLRQADAITAITEHDVASLRGAGGRRVLLAPPGPPSFAGAWLDPSSRRPRAVIVAGSYTWRVKLWDLEELLQSSVAIWASLDVSVVVAGKISDAALHRLRSRYPSVRFMGRLADIRDAYRHGRLAVVHEPRGGGFKIKSLDYAFAGLPIVATAGCLAGLPGPAAITYDRLDQLVSAVPGLIDDPGYLDYLRLEARTVVGKAFDWSVSGRTLRAALDSDGRTGEVT